MKSEQPFADAEDRIIETWEQNTVAWINAINNGEIASRVNVTDQAILDVILAQQPHSVLDVGCGEGWLVRALANEGIDACGIDVVPAFIDYARRQKSGRFEVMAYENMSATTLVDNVDVVVCNFSLLGNESVQHVFRQVPELLTSEGVFIIQTLHPLSVGAGVQQEGWRDGSWAGFSEQFHTPAPWYFRTIESWQELFVEHGLQLQQTLAPTDPETGQPGSIIFVAQRSGMVADVS